MTPTTTRTAYQAAVQAAIRSADGRFGPFGGMYVPEVLRPNMETVAAAFARWHDDPDYQAELRSAWAEFSGRPTPLTPLPRLSAQLGGAQLYLKNEGLNLTGAHKINHCIGQILLARRMGRQRIIAETGAGQHGYATATVCARYGLACTVYMGRRDYERQRPNVFWMETLGATVVPVDSGAGTLNDAVIAAFQDLIAHPDETFYLLGSAVGPHPYPAMNTWLQAVVGQEVRSQLQAATGRLPDAVVACVGGGSNALGIFHEFLDEPDVQLVGVEAGGTGTALGQHAAKAVLGREGIFEGYRSLFLQDDDANIAPTGSISAGLDYCGLSPLLAWLHREGRVQFQSATDAETLEGLRLLARSEGILLALESAHGLAGALQIARQMRPDQTVVINGSGRAEKDLFITFPRLQPEAFRDYLQQQLTEHSARA